MEDGKEEPARENKRPASDLDPPQPLIDKTPTGSGEPSKGAASKTTAEKPNAVKRRRKPQLSSENLEYDAMYVSPLDSNPQVFFGGLIAVFLASVGTRLYKISEPGHVA